jgi:hypothetical protein
VDATVATKEEETHYYLSDTVRCCHLSTWKPCFPG